MSGVQRTPTENSNFWKQGTTWIALAAIVLSSAGVYFSFPQISDAIPALFDGFLGALLGAVVSVFVLKGSIRGLQGQIREQAHENDKSRERIALAACISELWKLIALFEKGNFPARGESDSTFDSLRSRLSELRLQMLAEDPRLMAVLRVWQEVLQEDRNNYWRLRDASQESINEYEASNLLGRIATKLNYLATQLAAYGRTGVGDRQKIVDNMAAAASDAVYERDAASWYEKYVHEDSNYLYWPFDVPRPPLG